MTFDPFAAERVDHLILLVGGNTLPNAVLGSLLSSMTGRITLLHSVDTNSGATQLYDYLTTHRTHPVTTVKLRQIGEKLGHESRRRWVEAATRNALNEMKGAKKVGLGYTGGTKAMSVHAFRVAEQWAEQTRTPVVFAYLDAGQLSVNLDVYTPSLERNNGGEWTDNAGDDQEQFVGNFTVLLPEMLHLHKWRAEAYEEPVVFLPASSQAIRKVTANALLPYLQWLATIGVYTFPSDPLKKPIFNRRAQFPIALPQEPELKPLCTALMKDFGLKDVTDLILETEVLNRLPTGANADSTFAFWANSKWLEEMTLDAVLKYQTQDSHVHTVYKSLKPISLETTRAVNSDLQNLNPEVDVVAIRGYQMFVLSCTTDDKEVAKAHLFEVVIRARQLGGDDARIALICTASADRVKKLQKEVEQVLPHGERVRVFGKDDLPNLDDAIGKWMKKMSAPRQ